MAYHGRRAVSAEMEDTVDAARSSGAELVRSSIRKAAASGAEAA
jgi:hypothetical protein